MSETKSTIVAIKLLFFQTQPKRGFLTFEAAGVPQRRPAGWSSSTNCSPAVSAWTGTGHPRCCPANTTTASSPAWRASWTTSSGRSSVRSVGRNTACPTTASKDFLPTSRCRDSWSSMPTSQVCFSAKERSVRERQRAASFVFFVRRITGSKCRRYYVKMRRMF